jgi:cell division protein FtsW (lipid II flippase)
MLIAALLVGAITAWYWGLRKGLWAAVITEVLCLAATFLPRYALPIYVALSVAVIALVIIGSKRPRPPDTVLAARWVAHRVRSFLSRKDEPRH